MILEDRHRREQASMEPRSIERGERGPGIAVIGGDVASMEPRSIERGEVSNMSPRTTKQ